MDIRLPRLNYQLIAILFTYNIYYSGNSGESDPISDPIREKIYIVFESKLLSLFTCCEKCHQEVDVTKKTNRSLLNIVLNVSM